MDFSPLFAWFETGFHMIKPFYKVDEWQGAILLRNGINKGRKLPGFHWKWPFIDELQTCSIATETVPIKAQSLVTTDNVSVFLEGAVKCNVIDPELYLLKVKDVENAISDLAQKSIKREIMTRTWDQCKIDAMSEEIENQIAIKLRAKAKKFGIFVDEVILGTIDRGRTIRLIQSNSVLPQGDTKL